MAGENQQATAGESRLSQQQYEMLLRCSKKRDMAEWNQWRKDNPDADILLEGADLEGAYLQGASLWRARLGGAHLVVANLKGAQLVEADLQGAKLAGVNLQGAELVEANLADAELVGANLEGARLWNADLCGACFTNATCDGGTLIWKCTVDRRTNFEGVPLESVRVDAGTKQLLEHNVRRMNWQDWYKQHRRLAWLVRPFWWISDYGRSTGRIILSFFVLAILFAIVYRLWPGLIAVGQLKGFWHALYVSVAAMTTLGFGNVAANPDSWLGQSLLMLQVILGYAFLAALVTRFAALFRAGGPAGLFAGEKDCQTRLAEGLGKTRDVTKSVFVATGRYLRDVRSRRTTRSKRQVKQWDRACPDVRTGWLGDFLEAGDVVHVQGRGLMSRLIRWFSRACRERKTWASHSAMVLQVGDRVEIVEALRKVVVRPISAYARTRSRLLVCRKPGGLDPDQKREIVEKAQQYRGRKYGVGKIFAHALDRLFNNRYVFRRLARMDDYPICSWLVAFVYDRVLGQQFGVPPNAAQPDDLLDHCVKEGWSFVWADSKESAADFCRVYGLTAGPGGPSDTSQESETGADEPVAQSGEVKSSDDGAAGEPAGENTKDQAGGE
ncbi:MAG: pentapeptide repeat-containing protein [Planctomycetota bacterium]